jgi:hypothetical protein
MGFDIYHVINENQKEENDLSFNIFLLIKSILNIDKKYKIYYYYYNLPNSSKNKLWNYLMNNYNDSINLIQISIPDRIFLKYKETYINKILYDNGGIYLNNHVILLNKIENNNDYFKTKNNEIIGSKKDSDIAYSLYLKNTDTMNLSENNEDEEPFCEENLIQLLNINYNDNNNFIDEIYENEIFDYSFGTYFHLINNCSFFIGNRDLYMTKDMLSKITIYNLLVKYVLGYDYMFNSNEIIDNNYDLINNIDTIYWLNLDRTKDRRQNMENILSKFSIQNERIPAIDGKLNNDIKSTYFALNNNSEKYPNYSNTEYAILASHLLAINKFINKELFSEMQVKENTETNVCLICEDDLSLDFIQYWKKPISEIISNAPCDWDIIMLGYFSLKLEYEEYSKWNNEWSAIAYLVNKNNIKDKFNQLKVFDNNNNFKWKCNEYDLMVSDNYIFSKFNTYVYKYPYFTFPNNNDSTLHEDHLSYHKIYKSCNYLVLNDILDLFW